MRRWLFYLFALNILFVGCQSQAEEPEIEAPISEQPESTTAVLETAAPETLPTNDETTAKADADVIFVLAEETAVNSWRFNVTVAHPDTGWEDYADGWDVVLPDGTVVKPDVDSPFTRLLLHPHETEQPFTRSQSNIQIPESVTAVTVRAHDVVDGFGGQEVVVNLETSRKTEHYEVKRWGD